MTAQQLLHAGHLAEAIKALTAEVRDNPTDAYRRTFLFELLCFTGDYSRAEKQLDVLAQSGPQAELGAVFYRGAVAAERTRQQLFEEKDYPRHSVPATPHLLAGTIGGAPFLDLTDCDPRIGANLEVFVAGSYMWIPFSMLASIHTEPPKRLRDLLWLPAVVRTSADYKDRELGEVLLPVLSPFSWKNTDEAVHVGGTTVWEENQKGELLPVGQKMLVVGGQEWPLLEVRHIEFQLTQAAS